MTSELLAAAWVEAQLNYYFVHHWSVDNPGELDQLKHVWNHGTLDPTKATIRTHYGLQLMKMGLAYYEALAFEATLRSGPLGPGTAARIAVGPDQHPPSWNHWYSADLKAADGDPVYAILDGKIPDTNPDDVDGGSSASKFAFDGVDGYVYGYAHVVPVVEGRSRVKRGDTIGHVAGGKGLHFACQNRPSLLTVIYST